MNDLRMLWHKCKNGIKKINKEGEKMKKRNRLFVWTVVLISALGANFMLVAQAVQEYHEAPMLHELVLQGKLPPVEQRLPKNPQIVEPYEEIGQYGGTLYRVFTGPGDFSNFKKFALDALIKRTPAPQPDIADWWKFEDNGKTLVLHIREGIKWSDGVPVTADDFIYFWNIRLNPDIPAYGVSSYMRDPAGKIATVEKIDDYTVKIHYSVPYPMAINTFFGEIVIVEPKHYLIQFDPRYNPNIKDYSLLTQKIVGNKLTPDWVGKPVLGAWVITKYVPGVELVAERNPYYWKVDPAGNQLPYIDRVVWQYVSSTDVIPLMAAAGKIDMQARKLSFSDYTFYKQNEKKGGYKTRVLTCGALGPAIHFNYDTRDAVLRSLFRNKDFRIALSYATNREEISKVFFKGLTEPWAYCQLPDSPFYPGDEYAKMYTQYDPARANAILDRLGLKDTDGDGIRNRPDGENLSIVVDYSPAGGVISYSGFLDLIASQWEKVGVKLIPNPMDRSLLWPRLEQSENGELEAYLWKVDAALNFAIRPYYWLPVESGPEQMYKSATRWYLTNGKEGERPSESWLLTAQSLYRQLLQATDPGEQIALGKQISQLIAENCYQLSTTTLVGVAIVKDRVGNVPDKWVDDDITHNVSVIEPCQFFIKSGK